MATSQPALTLTASPGITPSPEELSQASAARQSASGAESNASAEVGNDEAAQGSAVRLDFSLTQEEQDTANRFRWVRLLAILFGAVFVGLGGYGIWKHVNRADRGYY